VRINDLRQAMGSKDVITGQDAAKIIEAIDEAIREGIAAGQTHTETKLSALRAELTAPAGGKPAFPPEPGRRLRPI